MNFRFSGIVALHLQRRRFQSNRCFVFVVFLLDQLFRSLSHGDFVQMCRNKESYSFDYEWLFVCLHYAFTKLFTAFLCEGHIYNRFDSRIR